MWGWLPSIATMGGVFFDRWSGAITRPGDDASVIGPRLDRSDRGSPGLTKRIVDAHPPCHARPRRRLRHANRRQRHRSAADPRGLHGRPRRRDEPRRRRPRPPRLPTPPRIPHPHPRPRKCSRAGGNLVGGDQPAGGFVRPDGPAPRRGRVAGPAEPHAGRSGRADPSVDGLGAGRPADVRIPADLTAETGPAPCVRPGFAGGKSPAAAGRGRVAIDEASTDRHHPRGRAVRRRRVPFPPLDFFFVPAPEFAP
jgi:hypothetical protein